MTTNMTDTKNLPAGRTHVGGKIRERENSLKYLYVSILSGNI